MLPNASFVEELRTYNAAGGLVRSEFVGIVLNEGQVKRWDAVLHDFVAVPPEDEPIAGMTVAGKHRWHFPASMKFLGKVYRRIHGLPETGAEATPQQVVSLVNWLHEQAESGPGPVPIPQQENAA